MKQTLSATNEATAVARLIAAAAVFLVSFLPTGIAAPAAIRQHALVLDEASSGMSSKLLDTMTADTQVQGSSFAMAINVGGAC